MRFSGQGGARKPLRHRPPRGPRMPILGLRKEIQTLRIFILRLRKEIFGLRIFILWLRKEILELRTCTASVVNLEVVKGVTPPKRSPFNHDLKVRIWHQRHLAELPTDAKPLPRRLVAPDLRDNKVWRSNLLRVANLLKISHRNVFFSFIWVQEMH